MPSVPSSTPSTDNLPKGLDRADGLSGRLGTRTPSGAVAYNTKSGNSISNVPIEEDPGSPTLERGEQCTVRHRFTMAWQQGLSYWSVYGRGTLLEDDEGNFFRVLNTTITHVKPDLCVLDIVSEALSFDNPPDLFDIVPVNLNLDILKHPRYFLNLMPTNQIPTPLPSNVTTDTAQQIAVKQSIVRAVQAYKENPFIPTPQAINNMTGSLHDTITTNLVNGAGIYAIPCPNFNIMYPATASIAVGAALPPAATAAGQPNPAYYYSTFDIKTDDPNGKIALALAAAQEMIGKLWRVEDAPPVTGWEVSWDEFYWIVPPLNPGGYIEDPRNATPPLPDYFYSTANPPNPSLTIFDLFSVFNPQCYGATGQYNSGTVLSSLRMPDTFVFDRTFWKVTHKWLVSAYGAWDADINSGGNRPTKPSDYRPLVLA